jgi:hypothetical protein
MIQDLITLYKSKHNAEVIESEAKKNPAAFCARKYHASRACGCGNLGNNLILLPELSVIVISYRKQSV